MIEIAIPALVASLKVGWMGAGVAVAVALAIPGAASAQEVAATGTSAAVKPGAPIVAEPADRLLKEMGAYIGSAEKFTFHADITFDQVLPSGQKVQFSAAEEVALERPGNLYVEWDGDLGARQFWYDGKRMTLRDPATPFYASEAAPPEIDGMLDKLIAEMNFSPPLVDFLYRDPYKAVRENMQYGLDLGQHDVAGRACRTLAFVEKDIDWQIWIENGVQPTPCKLVITYKTQHSQPQFTAVFSDWDFDPHIAISMFAPELPAGSEQIPFATVAANK